MKPFLRVILPVLLAAALLLTACGKDKGNTVKVDGGEVTTGSDLAWPADKMGGLPSPGGKLTGLYSDSASGSTIAAFSDLSEDEANAYVASLKAKGYASAMEMRDEDTLLYSGTAADGSTVLFTFTFSSGEASLTFAPAGTVPAGGDNVTSESGSAGATDTTDVSPWPQGFLPGVPELAGKITNVTNQNNQNLAVNLEQVEKADAEAYVEALKAGGYTVDADDIRDSYSMTYSARNAAGDLVQLTMVFEYKSATVYMEKAAS